MKHGSLQPRQLVYRVLLVRFILGLGGEGGDQAAFVQLLQLPVVLLQPLHLLSLQTQLELHFLSSSKAGGKAVDRGSSVGNPQTLSAHEHLVDLSVMLYLRFTILVLILQKIDR